MTHIQPIIIPTKGEGTLFQISALNFSCGVHTFSGLDWVYEQGYYEKYPDKKPVIELSV